VVIDAATRRQVGGLFECRDLGTVELKGLPVAVPAWQVLGEGTVESRFEALRPGLTPLVGRDEEMELLLRRWAQAEAGNGRVVLISAEPHIRLRYFCTPHHQDSALYPVIAQMERAAGFLHADGPGARLARLQALLAATEPPIEDVALIAELHSLPSAGLAPLLDVTPQRKKDKTFDALLRQIEGLSRQQPVLMVFDDLHWVDPSSHELLDRLIERVADWPVLLLAMFRPEFQPPWIGQPHVTLLTLARLDRRNTAAMVANVAGDATVPPEIVEEITERTDGVPLFVEELTKAMLESGAQGATALSSVPHAALSVPATLHASLMARLDRLGPAAKEIAQTGAAIGREFGHGLLTSTIDLPEPQLHEALDRLTSSGLLFVRGTAPASSYIFKHALVQDAAYGTLLRVRRQGLHARIVNAFEDRFPEIVSAQPALLAHHCTEAGLTEKAVDYWLKAGQQAMDRSAMTEAVAQLRKGLDVLVLLPDGSRRQQQELDLQVALGSALTATSGFSAVEVEVTLTGAGLLAEQLDRPVLPLMVGQSTFHFLRAEYRRVIVLGQQIEQTGEARNDVAAQLLGRLFQGACRSMLGEFVAARALLERSMGLADPAYRIVAGLSFDPYPLLLGWIAHTLACLGYTNQARSRMEEALSNARLLGHAHTLALVLSFGNRISWIIGSSTMHIEEVLTLSTEQGFSYHRGLALGYRGRSLVGSGQAREALRCSFKV
jgi:predicted ATPase